jgi:hypothetical protein
VVDDAERAGGGGAVDEGAGVTGGMPMEGRRREVFGCGLTITMPFFSLLY